MQGPHIHISKRERRKYKSNVAAWEEIRKKGIIRFILVRGVLRVGVPIVAAFVAFLSVMSVMKNGFHIYPEVFIDPLNIGLMVASALVIGTRWKIDEWLTNEREYKAWKLYKSERKTLHVD
jgi:hypothetical protein